MATKLANRCDIHRRVHLVPVTVREDVIGVVELRVDPIGGCWLGLLVTATSFASASKEPVPMALVWPGSSSANMSRWWRSMVRIGRLVAGAGQRGYHWRALWRRPLCTSGGAARWREPAVRHSGASARPDRCGATGSRDTPMPSPPRRQPGQPGAGPASGVRVLCAPVRRSW